VAPSPDRATLATVGLHRLPHGELRSARVTRSGDRVTARDHSALRREKALIVRRPQAPSMANGQARQGGRNIPTTQKVSCCFPLGGPVYSPTDDSTAAPAGWPRASLPFVSQGRRVE